MRLNKFGEDAPFEYFDKPDTEPGPGEVSVRLHATSVNPVDTKIRADGGGGIAPDNPVILGCDVAGVVIAAGPGVSRFTEGEEVYGCAGGVKGRDGTYAQRMIADERLLAKKPETLSFREAAALPLVAITAWESLIDRANVQPGETVLVHGGSGGVGHIGVQLARLCGAVVHATVGNSDNARIATELGADETINYREHSVADYVERLTGSHGYDVVFDTVGGPNLESSIEALANNGRCATTVSLGASPDLSGLHIKNASLHVTFMLVPMLTDEGLEHHGMIMKRIATLVDSGRIKPLIDDSQFSLDDIGAAHKRVTSGKATGKVVVDID